MASNDCELLEVDCGASLDVIEAAYRRLALRYHPDRNLASDALQKMQQINGAYAVLRDPIKRLDCVNQSDFLKMNGDS